MQKFIALCLLAAMVAAAPQSLNDLTGQYSLWRPPTWPDFSTCCYQQGANVSLSNNVLTMQSLVMGPCAAYLPGTYGVANMTLAGPVSSLSTGVQANFQFYTTAGVHTLDKSYNVVYTVQLTPAPVDVLTFTSTTDSNCTYELRNATAKTTQQINSFFKTFLSKMTNLSNKLDMFFTRTVNDYTGKFSLWRPPTWQNFSNCCYVSGANTTFDATTQQLIYQGIIMGTCAQYLPGTYGVMKASLAAGSSFADSTLTMNASFYTTAGVHTQDLSFTVVTGIELTPAPIQVYTYHNVAQGSDVSCDFLLRQDTQ